MCSSHLNFQKTVALSNVFIARHHAHLIYFHFNISVLIINDYCRCRCYGATLTPDDSLTETDSPFYHCAAGISRPKLHRYHAALDKPSLVIKSRSGVNNTSSDSSDSILLVSLLWEIPSMHSRQRKGERALPWSEYQARHVGMYVSVCILLIPFLFFIYFFLQ